MIPILLLLVTLGTLYGNADPLWGDERNTIQSTGGVLTPQLYPLPQVWRDVAINHPEQLPEYQTFINLWMRLIGSEPAAIRMLSIFIGCLGAAWVYRLGRYAAASDRVGIVAALLWTTSMLIVYYLTRVRTYSLVATLAAFVLYFYLRAISQRKPPSRWLWAGLILGVAALLYTHYLVLLMLGALGLYHLALLPNARRAWMRRWQQVMLALIVAGLFYLPWLPNFVNGMRVEASHHERGLSLIASFGVLAEFFGNGLPLLALLALIAVVLTFGGRRLRPIYSIALLNTLILMAYFLISHRLRPTRPSYMIALWPMLDVLLAVAIVRLGQARDIRRWLAGGLLTAFVLVGIHAVIVRDAHAQIEHFRYLFPIQAVDLLLNQNQLVGERVVVALPDTLTDSEEEMSRIAAEDSRIDLKDTSYRAIRGAETASYQSAASDLSEWQRVWIAYAPDRSTSASAGFAGTLAGDFQQCPRSLALTRARLDQYARSLTCCVDDPDQAAVARFGDSIALLRVGLPTEPAHGQTEVTLLWAVGADVPPETYSITLQLFDSAGDKVGQGDQGIALGSRPCQPITLNLSSLPAGVYAVRIAVYNWRDGARLPAALGSAAPVIDLLPVGEVTVS